MKLKLLWNYQVAVYLVLLIFTVSKRAMGVVYIPHTCFTLCSMNLVSQELSATKAEALVCEGLCWGVT